MPQLTLLDQKPTKLTHPLTENFQIIKGIIPYRYHRPTWGIDPGINFGLTIIEDDRVFIMNGILLKDEEPGRMGTVAYKFLKDIALSYSHNNARLTIEGASYADTYGQVLLSEIRAGFFIAGATLPTRFSTVEIVPPKSIRKEALGDGTITGKQAYPEIRNRNAADSFAAALYGLMQNETQPKK